MNCRLHPAAAPRSCCAASPLRRSGAEHGRSPRHKAEFARALTFALATFLCAERAGAADRPASREAGLHSTPATAPAAHPHQHGIATLELAVEGEGFTLHLETPLEVLLGFEHAPRNAAERQAAQRVLARLRQPAGLFTADDAAGCSASAPRIEAPLLTTPATAAGAGPRSDEHGDLDAEYDFRCRRPAALKQLRVDLFDAFERLQRIDVQRVGPTGQSRHRLTRQNRVIRWP